VDYIESGGTIDGMAAVIPTIDGWSVVSFDSPYWTSGARTLAYFDTSHQLKSLVGASVDSSFSTGHAGYDDTVTLLSKIRLRFAPGYKPTTAVVTTYSTMTEGDAMTERATGSLNDGKFDVLQAARFHRADFSFTGDVRVVGISASLKHQGNN